MFWTSPDVTADRLLLSVMWTIWIWVGAVLAGGGETIPSHPGYREMPLLIKALGQAVDTKEAVA
jgi:hypothetical protein